jgi:outer membrane protein OmpA-like peptidoglycan-associated protein
MQLLFHGPDNSIASNNTDEGRAKNRRREFTVVKG